MSVDRSAYVKWIGFAGLAFSQCIGKNGCAAALRPAHNNATRTRPEDFRCDIRVWASQRSDEVAAKTDSAAKRLHDFSHQAADGTSGQEASAQSVEISLTDLSNDPAFAQWQPFIVEDHSSGIDYGIEQCVAWADEYVWLADWDNAHQTYDLGLVRLVLRDMFSSQRPAGILTFIHTWNDNRDTVQQLVAHSADPTYSHDVLTTIVERCHELASRLDTPKPALDVHMKSGPFTYSTDIEVADYPVLLAGESRLAGEVKPLRGKLFTSATSLVPEPIPEPLPVQPEGGGWARYMSWSERHDESHLSEHPLTSADPYLLWCARELSTFDGPFPDSLSAFATRAPGRGDNTSDSSCDSARFWVSELDTETYAWIADWAHSSSQDEFPGFEASMLSRFKHFAANLFSNRRPGTEQVEVVVGSPAADPTIEPCRPLMLLDRSGISDEYRIDAVRRARQINLPENTAKSRTTPVVSASPFVTAKTVLWLAGRGFSWFPGVWIVTEVTDTGFVAHVNPGPVADIDGQLAAFESRCQDLVTEFCTRPVTAKVITSGNQTFSESATGDGWGIVHHGPKTWPGSDEPNPEEHASYVG